MDLRKPERSEGSSQAQSSPHAEKRVVSRRDMLKLTLSAGAGLAVSGILDMPTVRAASQKLKLSQVNEYTTSCNFCSCGCGMVAAVRDGKLISMEGDYDHLVNRGSLCVKGISMFATHASPNRLGVPRYRAPGSDHWEDISWDDAIDRSRKRSTRYVMKHGSPQRNSATQRFPSIAQTRWPLWAVLRIPMRSAISSRKHCGC